jgi:TetR/AcrR family transcriptional regulator, transcriptional repressor for nem operon
MKDTKKHIMEVTLKLFLQKSYKEVTLKEIVEKTKLSKGAFYHYFDSKEKLFTEIIDMYFNAFMSVDYSKLNRGNLYEFYTDYMKYLLEEMKNLSDDLGINTAVKTTNFYFLVFDAMKIIPGFRKKLITMHESELKVWENIVKKSRESGEIKSSMTDQQIAKIFVRAADGIGIHLILFGMVDQIESELLDVWDAFYNSIKK